MSATLLANELNSLISDAKRKNTDLRNAAEKSLTELKAFPVTSEQQLAADLSHRPSFIDPFITACKTRNAKFASSGIVSLQRLIICKGLPQSRLKDALDAFNACVDLNPDIQLKILQALPSLLQNYAAQLEGELLSITLQVCSSLQAANASTVSGVAAATLQQLVTTVFEKVAYEDSHGKHISASEEVPGKNGPLRMRPAAFDAYRVFRDLALAADERSTQFVRFTCLSPESGLELIYSCIDSNPALFQAHEELMSVIGANVIPLVIRALSEKLSFSITVRSLRLLGLVLDRYLATFAEECEIALNLCTQALEPDIAPTWKRALVMEILRDLHTKNGRIIDAYAAFDGREGGKSIIQDIMSAFVRLSTEKPAAIGLGQQSTVPTGPPSQKDSAAEQAAFEATGGMAGVFSTALGVAEASVSGISSEWSLPKLACIDQLDKNEAPSLPETYVYALVLECFSGLSEGLAKVVLPLTIQHDKVKSKNADDNTDANGNAMGRERSASFRTRAIPFNPLSAEDAPYAARIRAVAGLVDTCWPAVLATSSTYLNAALDDHYFRNLIKAYQRFAQVAGLLRLATPRDALMTTLARVAVPPHVLNAAIHDSGKSPINESPRVFSNPKSLLSVESLVSQTSTAGSEKERRGSLDAARPMLTVRNLLCLRALLNLAIALGPTLHTSFAVILNALKQADMVLSATTPQQMTRQVSSSPVAVQAFSNEISAVEGAASRLLESTADFPNDAFMVVMQTFCQLLRRREQTHQPSILSSPTQTPHSPHAVRSPRRTLSGLPGISSYAELQPRDYQFIIPKLGHLAELNVSRLTLDDPAVSGYAILIDQLTLVAAAHDTPREARRGATNVLVKLADAMIAYAAKEDPNHRAATQRRSIVALLKLVDEIYEGNDNVSASDFEIQCQVLDALRTILERSGDSLVAGWTRIIAIISSAFTHTGSRTRGSDEDEVYINWDTVTFSMISAPVGRSAFTVTQLVCSDFLDSLPGNVLPSLVELLHRFMCQTDDINAALTTVTMAWNLADFLFDQCTGEEIAEFVETARDAADLDSTLLEQVRVSKPTQWLLILARLRDVATAHEQKEIRNAAFQTICNVFRNHGKQLSPTTWDLLLRSTLLRISKADSLLYAHDGSSTSDRGVHTAPDISMSQTLISGISEICASHLHVIEMIARLPSLWEVFLTVLERYLDIESHVLDAEVYAALARIVGAIDTNSTVWQGPAYRALSLWLKRRPSTGDGKRSNQDAYAAYVDAGHQLHRLAKDMRESQRRTVINNLWHCIETANGVMYGGDSHLSPLQSKILQLLKAMQRDHPDDVSGLVTIAAKLIVLHHDRGSESGVSGYVALAGECIPWLVELLKLHVKQDEVTNAMHQALNSLRKIISAKYGVKAVYRSTPLWKLATTAAVELARPVLDLAQRQTADPNDRTEIWSAYIGIAGAIVNAQDLHLAGDARIVQDDMAFDIDAFKRLRESLIPGLGSHDLSQQVREGYAQALFKASIIHDTERTRLLYQGWPAALVGNNMGQRGSVRRMHYSLREDMSYVCWKELLDSATKGTGDAQLARIAETITPLLVARLALPIATYVANQPLRGRKPQQLSEVEELLFALQSVQNLQLESTADQGLQAHTRVLYPVLVQAIGIAGERSFGSEEILGPLRDLLASMSSLRLADKA